MKPVPTDRVSPIFLFLSFILEHIRRKTCGYEKNDLAIAKNE